MSMRKTPFSAAAPANRIPLPMPLCIFYGRYYTLAAYHSLYASAFHGRPNSANRRRILTRSGWFICNRTTVARPCAVIPPISNGRCSDHRKWSSHACVLGLKSAIVCPDAGSSPSMYAHLRALQCRHAKAILATSVCPPRERGRIWSISKPPI